MNEFVFSYIDNGKLEIFNYKNLINNSQVINKIKWDLINYIKLNIEYKSYFFCTVVYLKFVCCFRNGEWLVPPGMELRGLGIDGRLADSI